jgi:hypothetical protein
MKREESEPPKWMGKLQASSARLAFTLGLLLLGLFPTDILTTVAVGTYLAGHGDPLSDAIPFILLTLPFLALPSLILLIFRERARTFLPKAREWMNTNSWVVNEIVIVFFIVITINSLAA